jgi:hypothetical protein
VEELRSRRNHGALTSCWTSPSAPARDTPPPRLRSSAPTERGNRRYRIWFNKFLNPSFDQLLLVHNDYMQMFERTRSLLPRTGTSSAPAIPLWLEPT